MRSRAIVHARRLVAALALGGALSGAAAADARVFQAESVLPPGQSGFVSATGVASGTGSPHLTDQTQLFIDFGFKSALFGQPGETETPRDGVTIVRGPFGVPSITGASDFDAWWGVGYAVAQDRLFQLELFRRAGSGRLAEIVGEDFLDEDLIARRDYYTDAELDEMIARIPQSLRTRAEAYRDGINAWIDVVRGDPTKLPGEFAALGVELPTWTLRDTARIGILLARTVPSGDGAELPNARALAELGPRAFDRLLPLRTKGRVPTVPKSSGRFSSQPGRTLKQERAAFQRTRRFLADLALPTPASGATATQSEARGGSYMWAIGRKRPKGRRLARPGNAYLFNGPQLGFSIPELFVEFELHSPVQDMRGVSAAGVPVLGIGHNGRVAWGLTSGLSDEDDLYAERLTGPESYMFEGQERRMDCRDERFDFRSPPTDLPGDLAEILSGSRQVSGSRTEHICRTVHGPVQQRAGGVAYARRYAIWNRELETLVGLSTLNDADTIRDVDRAMLQVTWNENVVAADDQGNVGYWHPGLHPLRPKAWDERLPYPGTGEAEWRGLLSRRKTPHVVNPRQGYVMQWNNVPSLGWTAGDGPARERLAGGYHRAGFLNRLVKRVTQEPSYEASRAIDRRSGTTAQQRPLATRRLRLARRGLRGNGRKLLDTLLEWDGDYNRTDPQGTVSPGVAIWEEYKDQVEAIALFGISKQRPGPGTDDLLGSTSTSHEFDITNGEAHGLRVLGRRGLRLAALRAFDQLAARFRNAEPDTWREPRKMYEVMAQGAASPPELPFFDRGTWQQSVGLGP